jgi:LCP family protein required for cell wall assembly
LGEGPGSSMPAEPAPRGVDAASAEHGRHRQRPAPREWWMTALFVVVGVLAAVTGVALGAAALTVDNLGDEVARLSDAFPSGDRPSAAPESLTFLAVGTTPAKGTGGPAAESLTLVHVTGDRKGMQVVGLPTGDAGGIAGAAGATLGEAFDTGGTQRLVGAVEALTGVRVDHVALLDFAGFQAMTDALGGVTIDVPVPYRGGGHVFPAGPQRVDGAAALAYVRTSGPGVRAGAADRQQQVIQALFDRVSEQGLHSDLGRLTETLLSLTRSVQLDESLDNPGLVALAWELRGVGSPDYVTAPTDARAAALWAYLRTDSLGEHLGEFR